MRAIYQGGAFYRAFGNNPNCLVASIGGRIYRFAVQGTVATVGFPNIGLQGFAPKLAKGEIASLSGAGDDARYFQISVPVQPGNSGGALVDERGNVVGGELPPGVLRAAEVELGTLAPHTSTWRRTKALPWAERVSRATPVAANEPPAFANFLGAAPYSPAGYGPQVLAVWAGQIIGLSVETIVRLGRVLNAGLAFALIALALGGIGFPGGAVYLREVPATLAAGDVVQVLIEDSDAHDLFGVIAGS